ncbi:Coiled-coil domain-containing protein 43 [Amphibalanus amphitrite]|uniref:Coiled-coil domain-containing protein 43 n=1 Tax=Amphibalanus amphitrite TaxID=1232801 RepID=A0A6A4VQR6_AMPAM|nr:Coiled-coil domain-containing protein 43 [Amphibalanus amphitrite]
MEEFQAWLTNKLLSLESDDSVITDYINGILTGDESQPEKEEALQGILCGIMVDIEDQLSKIMEQQNLSATVTEKPKVSNADKKLKEAILQQYAEVSDHEEDEEGGGEEQLEATKNTNRDEVTREEQERRERMKAEAAAKREKDKLDREKQKQQQAERKDKEKKRTAKTEKRR